MDNSYPCVFGFISLDNSPCFFQPPNFVKTLFQESKTVGIYETGVLREFHLHENKNNLIILIGRIYDPFSIDPNTKNIEKEMAYLENAEFGEIHGNFLAILKSFSISSPNITIVADKYGSRRLLYFMKEKSLFFSTHLLGLKILLENKLPSISTEALLHYYNFGFTSNHQTLLEGIQKLPPGSILNVKNGNLSINKYFSIRKLYRLDEYKNQDEKDVCRHIDESMLKAVSKRNTDKSSVGIALSGGVDSGYIAQKLVQIGVDPIGYNLSYEASYNEYDRIEYLEKRLGLRVRKISLSPDQIIENYKYCNSISSEPMGFNNACMRFVALEAKKDGINELFDGDGTDRLFLGMSRYLLLKKIILIYELLKKSRFFPFTLPLLRIFPGKEQKKLYIHFKNWDNGIHPYLERDMEGLTYYDYCYEKKIYDLAINRFCSEFEYEFESGDFGLFFTYQSIQMCPEMFFYDPAEIQSELGIFPISPYWDDDIVSLAISLPTELKIRRGKTKYILRKAASENLDQKYWMKSKIGLQSSFKYIGQSTRGSDWISVQYEKIINSEEYKILKEIVPGGKVILDKLVSVIIWKGYNQDLFQNPQSEINQSLYQ